MYKKKGPKSTSRSPIEFNGGPSTRTCQEGPTREGILVFFLEHKTLACIVLMCFGTMVRYLMRLVISPYI